MENSYLIVDDVIDGNPIPKEILERMPMPQSGKAIHGTFGTFSIKEFEKMTERLKHDTNCLCI